MSAPFPVFDIVVVKAPTAAPSIASAVENIRVFDGIVDRLRVLALPFQGAPFATTHVGVLDVSLAHVIHP